MDINNIERQLRKRLAYPYKWHKPQNNEYDSLTRCIYTSDNFDYILEYINSTVCTHSAFEEIRDYALNRWFNYWSSQGVEYLFSLSSRVIPAPNKRDHTTDFTIDGIQFDHKTSVFPKGFSRPLHYAQGHPEDLIKWFYRHQSQEHRRHLKNRLFLVVYASDGQHWKLKAELSWLQEVIERYTKNFSATGLHTFTFEQGSDTLSDIIWGIK